MHIALLTFEFAPLSGRLKLEAETLIRQGHQVHVIYGRVAAMNGRQACGDGDYCESFVGVDAANRWQRAITLPAVYRRILRQLDAESPQVVHCAHPLLLPPALSFKRSRPVKVIYDAYEFYSVMWSGYSRFGKALGRRMLELIENKLAGQADYILTIDAIDGLLEHRYRQANPRVTVLYNFPKLATGVSEELTKELRAKYEGVQLVVYAGGVYEHKGVATLLDAIELTRKRIPQAKLLLIGHVLESERFRTVARERPESVELVPWLPYDEMLAYLQVAKVGLAPYPPTGHYLLSRWNARKFFTYMEAGLPIVGPDFAEIAQVVRDEQCGLLVDTADAQRISDAIAEMLSRPEWAAQMGARGRRAFIERYNWDIEQHKLLEAYAALGIDGLDGSQYAISRELG